MPTSDDLSPGALATGVEVHSRLFRDMDAYRALAGSDDAVRRPPEQAP